MIVTTAPSRVIGGRYRLLRRLGQGGMGTVWEGHDGLLDRRVAVKEVTLPPGTSDAHRAETIERATRREVVQVISTGSSLCYLHWQVREKHWETYEPTMRAVFASFAAPA